MFKTIKENLLLLTEDLSRNIETIKQIIELRNIIFKSKSSPDVIMPTTLALNITCTL